MDEGDLNYPPMFSYEKWGGNMTPEKYISIYGNKFEYNKDTK